MDHNDLADHNSTDKDEVSILKKKLSETEEKLLKFKDFVVKLRNERSELQKQINENSLERDKLKSELGKYQNKSYQQVFQNFQNLQIEYDKIQDEVELVKKTNKEFENDIIKSNETLTHSREVCEQQKEIINSLKSTISQHQSQINEFNNLNKELESKVIVLETEYKAEKSKNNNYQQCENEKNEANEKLSLQNNKINELYKNLSNSSLKLSQYEKELSEKNDLIKEYENDKKNYETIKVTCQTYCDTITNQTSEIEIYKQNVSKLNTKLELQEKTISDLKLSYAQAKSSLELSISDLKNKLKMSDEDLKLNIAKFDEYKLKVANVLKENRLNNFDNTKNIEHYNLKIETLEEENKCLKNKYEETFNHSEKLNLDNASLNSKLETFQSQLTDCEALKHRINLLTNENDKLVTELKQLKLIFSKEKNEISKQTTTDIENLKSKYETRIKELENEIEIVRNTSEESNSTVNSNTSFEEIRDESSSVISNNLNFLEEILNPDSNIKILHNACNGSNIDNLTQLLAENENSISLLSEQNRVLKEEIRRLHRSLERIDIADNLEYLKNVLMKFISIDRMDEKQHLITVLTTILRLTPDEQAIFQECVSQNHDPSQSSSNSKWSLWQWS